MRPRAGPHLCFAPCEYTKATRKSGCGYARTLRKLRSSRRYGADHPAAAPPEAAQLALRAAFLAGAFLAPFFVAGFLAALFFAGFLAGTFSLSESSAASLPADSPRAVFAASTLRCRAASRSTTSPPVLGS